MLTGIALLFILAITGYLVILPLVRREYTAGSKTSPISDEKSLERTKEAVFTTINEIEFDYKMKKLSDDDYQNLKQQYKQKALEILHEEDELELRLSHEEDEPELISADTELELAAEIELELEALRRQRQANTGVS
jgi:hypothetical protein